MDRITDAMKETLQNLSGKTITGDFTRLVDVLDAFNAKYLCEVTFSKTPSDATIVVKKGTATIAADSNGKYHLKEGTYTYTASAEGYTTKADQTLVITNSDEATGSKTVTVVLEVAAN